MEVGAAVERMEQTIRSQRPDIKQIFIEAESIKPVAAKLQPRAESVRPGLSEKQIEEVVQKMTQRVTLLTNELPAEPLSAQEPPCLSRYQPAHRRHPENQQARSGFVTSH